MNHRIPRALLVPVAVTVTVVAIAAMQHEGPAAAAAVEGKPASPRGQAAAQVGGKVVAGKESAGFSGGKWVEVDYGRPLLRGRTGIFGSGADYGKNVNGGAPVWRAGANETTRLRTEAALVFGGKKLPPGEYNLFVELKEGGWTLIISTQPALAVGEAKSKTKMWGAYGFDPRFDVARVPMTMSKSDRSIEEFTIEFVDVSARGGTLQISWEHTVAAASFTAPE